jgi:hypothetical protein
VLGPDALEPHGHVRADRRRDGGGAGPNPELQTEAFQRKIAFASPNTLMALLTVVERMWTRDKLQKQVGAIGEDAGKVLDAVTAFLDDFDKLGSTCSAPGEGLHRLAAARCAIPTSRWWRARGASWSRAPRARSCCARNCSRHRPPRACRCLQEDARREEPKLL